MTAIAARLSCVAVVAACLLPTAAAHAAVTAGAPPAPVQHVFVIVLENQGFDTTFGSSSPAPYLSQTLAAQGQLLTQYYGIGHQSLDNYIAMISGQAPNPQTQADCLIYSEFVPPVAVLDPNGQAVGDGCVFPKDVVTLADQLDQSGHTWRGYMDDMKTPCRHPALGTQDQTQKAKVGDQYAARHDPFVYFHSIIDDDAACRSKVVDLSQLPTDLQRVESTPNLSFITPNLCHDGHDKPCVDGQPGGLVSADAFLQDWVPQIVASPAFQRDGMLLIMFDEADSKSADADAACCGEMPGPNSPRPGINGPGGGRVGGVVLSPFTAAGSTNATPYNHYALLRTIEDLFGLSHLGFAAANGLAPFGADVFNASAQATSTTATTTPAAESSSTGGTGRLVRTGGSEAGVVWAATALVAALVVGMVGRRARRRA